MRANAATGALLERDYAAPGSLHVENARLDWWSQPYTSAVISAAGISFGSAPVSQVIVEAGRTIGSRVTELFAHKTSVPSGFATPIAMKHPTAVPHSNWGLIQNATITIPFHGSMIEEYGAGSPFAPEPQFLVLSYGRTINLDDDQAPAIDRYASIAQRLARLDTLSCAASIAERLFELRELLCEEGTEIVVASAETLFNFLERTHITNEPGVAASQNGILSMEWRPSRGRLFTLQFMPDGYVRFVVLAPDPEIADRKIRLAGVASVESVLGLAAPEITRLWI